MRRKSKVIYYHENHKLVILRSPQDSKAEVLQWWSTQDWSGSFPTHHGVAALFLSTLPIVLRKNSMYHYLYAFMISIRISLGTLSQMISPHSNQILCSIYEQSDFRISISYFPFFFLPSFPFSLPLFLHFISDIFLILSSHSHA